VYKNIDGGKQFMVMWGHQRNWEEERGLAPAGPAMPAGGPAAIPPPFVYKRRLYVLARKAPVLDHRQVEIDSIFGTDEPPKPKPVHQVQTQRRTAVHRPAIQRTRYGQPTVRRDETDRRLRPLFVPRGQ
jgi:hypothetical protein